MFTRLLVPLDGSPLGEIALPAARVLARRFEAELYLMRTEHLLASEEEASSEQRSFSPSSAQMYLDRLAQELTEEGIITHTMLPPVNPAGGIIAQAELDQVDLIVMATHWRTGFDALLHPSVTWRVFSRTAAPVLVCKRTQPGDPIHQAAPLPRFMVDATAPLIVPLDGSLQAEAALPLARLLAQTFGNPLRLVQVVAYPMVVGGGMGPTAYTDEMAQWSLAEAENYLNTKRAEIGDLGLRVTIESSLGFPVSSLEACVREHKAGLVVMTSHGRGWLGRLALGNVAKSLLGKLPLPILLVLLARPLPALPHADKSQIPAEVLEGWAR